MKERKAFIDWMKTIGIILIVYGHCFPMGEMTAFIYAFNVPLFFVVSGYLTKINEKTFIRKMWQGLILPYLLLSIIKNLHFYITHRSCSDILMSLGYLMVGIHGDGEIPGCGNLWFVYALLLNKMWLLISGRYRFLGIIPCVLLLFVYKNNPLIPYSCAIVNSFMSYPLFVLGYWAKRRIKYKVEQNPCITWVCAFVLLFFVWRIAHYNGVVSMWLGGYGNDFVLFILGSLIGVMAIYLISTRIKSTPPIIKVVSSGTIIILAFHMPMVRWLSHILVVRDDVPIFNNLALLVVSVIIVFVFTPIIVLIQKFMPWLIGRRKC